MEATSSFSTPHPYSYVGTPWRPLSLTSQPVMASAVNHIDVYLPFNKMKNCLKTIFLQKNSKRDNAQIVLKFSVFALLRRGFE